MYNVQHLIFLGSNDNARQQRGGGSGGYVQRLQYLCLLTSERQLLKAGFPLPTPGNFLQKA